MAKHRIHVIGDVIIIPWRNGQFRVVRVQFVDANGRANCSNVNDVWDTGLYILEPGEGVLT